MTPVQQILHQEPSPYLKPCPTCGFSLPTSCKICWRCGEVRDYHLLELAPGVKS